MTVAPGARFVGASVLRREDPRLLTGRGTYVDDIVIPGALHASFVRSELPRGSIMRVDVAPALLTKGVKAAFVAADLNPLVRDRTPTLYVAGPQAASRPPTPGHLLAESDVRHV